MKITVLVEGAETPVLRELGDAMWAAQKNDPALSAETRDALKGLSTRLHAEAARLEKKHG